VLLLIAAIANAIAIAVIVVIGGERARGGNGEE